jgi:predicted acetyltransferase
MNAQLIKATPADREVIKNLMQLYIYDFSEYVDCDVENNGLFKSYPNLEDYWKEENDRFPYIIMYDNKYAGFALIRFIKTNRRNYFSVAEFFVMRKYRRKGIGRLIAEKVFDLHKGQWEVYQKQSNTTAQLFWSRVIDDYTKGRFEEHFENGRRIQDFEN